MNAASLSLPLSLAGWFWLPNLVTRQLLTLYHKFLISRHGKNAVPVPGSPAWQQHYRIAYATAVLGYLAYNLVEAARSAPPNLFQVLGVTPNADTTALRNAYRAFAKRYHPDRAGPESETLFIAIRDAYEALKDPVKRFAYERFGPDVLKWKDCTTPKEFISRGLMRSSGFYIMSGVVLLFMSIFMKASPVAYWHYILYFSMFASELCLILGHESYILNMILPEQVPYQHVLGLHNVFVFLSMGLSRVIPVVFPEPMVVDEKDPRTYKPLLERLQRSLEMLNLEAHQQLSHEFRVLNDGAPSSSTTEAAQQYQQPLAGGKPQRLDLPPDVSNALFREMEDIFVEQSVRMQPPLRQLWDAAVQRHREKHVQDTPTSHTGATKAANGHVGPPEPETSGSGLSLKVSTSSNTTITDPGATSSSNAREPVSPISPGTRVSSLLPVYSREGSPLKTAEVLNDPDVIAGPPSPRPSPSPPPPNLRRRSGSPKKIDGRALDSG